MTDRKVLPPHITPNHYDLKLWPDLINLTFKGHVKININIKETCKEVKVNCNEVEVQKSWILNGQNQEILSTGNKHDKDEEVTTINFDQDLKPGDYVLCIDFTGILNDQMAGFYRSEYVARDGSKKFMGTTQFEATDARRAFPCWDEPALKATFKISMVVPFDHEALSNMDVEKVIVSDDKLTKEVSFNVTPIMSTYLVAFVVSELDYIEQVTSQGVKMRVYTPPGLSEQGRFGLEVGAKCLSFLSDYFGEPYPLPKMDFVAIPDFSAGAMENWGLVTYRTIYILFEEGKSSLRAKQNLAYTVAHELAHQWFGNLVTMEWWTDLWLNEGFATWVGWLAVDHLFPEWDIWTEFFVNEQVYGLGLDCLRNSHPIEVDVKSPAEITQVFDSISYSKGACVIRMLVNFLGSDVFVKGLRAYLKKHRYGNAKTIDLWNSLNEASGLPVSEMMHSWSRKTGFPVVKVEHTADKHKYCFCQNRFLSSGDVTEEEAKDKWYVPLRVVTKPGEEAKPLLLKEKSEEFTFDPDRKYLKLNFGQTGFYRVIYPSDELEKLKSAIESMELHASDRVGLISDCFSISLSGMSSVVDALSILSAYKNDKNFVVWDEISSALGKLSSVWFEQPQHVQDKLNTLTRSLFAPKAKELGWEKLPTDSHSDTILRTVAIETAGKKGEKEIVEEALKRFKKIAAGESNVIHPDLFTIVCTIAVANGGEEEFNQLIEIYKKLEVPDQKVKCLSSLCATPHPHLITRALEFSLTDDVRNQDIVYIFAAAASNPKGRYITWKFFQDKWDVLYKRYHSAGFLFGYLVSSSSSAFASLEMAEEVKAFYKKFQPSEISSVSREIEQCIEKIQINANWIKRDAAPVAEWLEKNVN